MSLPRFFERRFTITTLTVIAAVFIMTIDSTALWRHLFQVLNDLTWRHAAFTVALFVVLTAMLTLVLSLIGVKYLFKPLLIVVLLMASATAYFMDQNGIVIDSVMIRNIAETNYGEASELLTMKFVVHLMLTGILPALLVLAARIRYRSLLRETLARGATMMVAVVVIGGTLFAFYKDFSYIGREHSDLRFYVNPTFPLHSVVRYVIERNKSHEVVAIGTDAHRPPRSAHDKPRLLIVVVGETARAQEFSLNGYARPTNPELQAQDVISFGDVSSCGTATAVSVPCMFSGRGRDDYDGDGEHYENLLDVLTRAGVQVSWRDNNSGCKGVCVRVPSQQVSDDKNPRLCHDGECYDEELLEGLQGYLDGLHDDAVLVLHQMGSHGPAYYRRHPAAWSRFMPECAVANVEDCSTEMLVNAYDNTIAYTDHVLAEVIRLLRHNDRTFDSAMIYLSDHGESLGEHGVYLHGLPYAIAPQEQTHVPMVLWLSDGLATHDHIDKSCLANRRNDHYSHDNLFHSVLGVMKVETRIYQRGLDVFATCRV